MLPDLIKKQKHGLIKLSAVLTISFFRSIVFEYLRGTPY